MSPRARGRPATDLSAVLGAIARTAAQMCEARDALMFLVDGDHHRLVARHGRLHYPQGIGARRPIRRDTPLGRALLDRRPVHVKDLRSAVRREFRGVTDIYRTYIRTILAMPLLRDGVALGGIVIRRTRVQPFTPKQIALLKTFAEQAAIAIENARLSTELQAKNADLSEALDQQTATSEILRVISGSPTSLEPVLEAIAANAARVCGAYDATVLLREGDLVRRVAHHGPIAPTGALREVRPLSSGFVANRAILECRPVHIHDILATEGIEFSEARHSAPRYGFRTVLGVPLIREHDAIGALTIRRQEVHPFTEKQITLLQTFADQAVIAIENVRLFTELEQRNRALTEALEQQTATAEILRVIAESPTEIQPVLDTIARNAARVCAALDASVSLVDGDVFRVVGRFGPLPVPVGLEMPIDRRSVVGRAIVDRATIRVDDAQALPESEYPLTRELARRFGHRSSVATPLLHRGIAIGEIYVRRMEVRPFTDGEVALLRTFADQAVIAIENVRLFTELEQRNRALSEALEQQTATSEILRVISSSPTNLQPVMDTVARNAAQLCDAADAQILRVDGDTFRLVASHGTLPMPTEPRPIRRTMMGGRAVIDKQTVHVPDVFAMQAEFPDSSAFGLAVRSLLATPLLREGSAIGVILARRTELRPFSHEQIRLLETFADQAVIAIENVRLFTELQQRNAALAQSLEQQTATGEILRVISRSPTDVQPVFDAIVRSAVSLCGGMFGIVLRFDGATVHLAAHHNLRPEGLQAYEQNYPMPVSRETVAGGAILDRKIVQVVDMHEGILPPRSVAMARAVGFRSVLVVPMLRDGEPIGVINVARREPGPFSERHVALLQTFADQAVIAVENVRLFKELEERNGALTAALEQQTATAEILSVISSSPTDLAPVFDAILANATRLCDAHFGILGLVIDGQYRQMADRGAPAAFREWSRMQGPVVRDPRTGIGRMLRERRPIHISDLTAEPLYAEREPFRVATVELAGARTFLAVPMLKDGNVVGGIVIYRPEVRPFTDQQIGLVQTFANQAVIAIENVRLFTELQTRTKELTRSVGQLTALGEVGQAVSSTLDLETVLTTIASRASQLTATDTCTVYEYDEQSEEFYLRATHNVDERVLELTRVRPIRKGEGVGGRVAETRAPVQIEDVAEAGAYHGPLRDALLQAGVRSVLATPLLREERLIGVLIVTRKTAGRFADEVVALLQTFGTQSAIAIQNARLFRELEAKGRELETASRHKSQFLANMSHELRTPMNAILGYTELIADGIYGGVPEPMRDVLGRVEASGRHLLGLINDVLDLSKIEAGQLTLLLADYSMKEVVDAVVSAVDALAAAKGLHIVVDLAPALPTGRGDQRRLAQVLLNLVGNAIKFSDQGEIAVRVGAASGLFTVAVTDSGPGIAAADQERIFEEFQQADTSTTRPKGGTGLGLAIARRIVAMHGGRIWVESEPGAGATFRFTIPVRVAEQVC